MTPQPGRTSLLTYVSVGPASLALLEHTIHSLVAGAVLKNLHLRILVHAELDRAQARATLQPVSDALQLHDLVFLDLRPGANFLTTIAADLEQFPQADLVIVTAGASLPYAWDARLQKAACADRRTAVALPFCNAVPLFALCAEDTGNPYSDTALDRATYCLGEHATYAVPAVHAACAYLRRDALLAGAPVAGDWTVTGESLITPLARYARAIGMAGWNVVLADFLHVGFHGAAAIREVDAHDPDLKAYVANHPAGALRRAVAAAQVHDPASWPVPGLDGKPVQLHLLHAWGGGLDKWVREYSQADGSRINLRLQSVRVGDAGGQRLMLFADGMGAAPLRTWDIAQPIRSTASSSLEYRRILDHIVAHFNVEAILISSLIGHALDTLTMPVKTVVICHDYYPVCQVIFPYFNGTCSRCTLPDLGRCARENPLNSEFSDRSSDEWHVLRTLYVSHVLEHRIDLVAPTPNVIAKLRELDPRLEQARISLIPHGIALRAEPLPMPARRPGDKLRIVVLGRINRLKGLDLLRAGVLALQECADVTLVGCGAGGVELAAGLGWTTVPQYQTGELPEILRRIAPHAGLLASIYPETFSYTLSELMTLGVPPVATDLGAFRDRIVDGENGFLFDPSPEGLSAVLARLKADPALLQGVARHLAGLPPHRTAAEMVQQYHGLIPLDAHTPARFAIGQGTRNGLTEAYGHLDQAYKELTSEYSRIEGAYQDVHRAYESAHAAYVQANTELTEVRTRYAAETTALRSIYGSWAEEFDALQPQKQWWHLPRAIRLTLQLRERINAIGLAAADQAGGSVSKSAADAKQSGQEE